MLAPIKGVDARENMAAMDPLKCVYSFNLMPKNFGSTVRKGYREWANGVTGIDGVRTMMTFHGLAEDESEDKLFACTSEGIFDVTPDGETAPTQVVTWTVQGAGAGLTIFTQFTTAAGAFLLVADGDNGYFTYAGSTGTWTEVPSGGGGITGPADARDLVFVTVWKNRVWFVEKNSGTAWYLPVGSFLGSATLFEFGNKFRYGGHLVGLWNWTLDGGNGVDDYLVAISEAGDVIVYRGTDPAQASEFSEVGSWFLGAMPSGRRVASDFGGDLMVLSSYGLTSMSALLNGQSIASDENYLSAAVSPYIRIVMAEAINLQGWEINADPAEGIIIIDTPTRVDKSPVQFVMNMGTNAWGFWRDVPLATMVSWHGDFYFGSQDEDSVWVFQGDVDRNYIDPEADGAAVAINWSILSGYTSFGMPAQNKIMQFLRPVFAAEAAPAFEIVTRYDFDIRESSLAPIFNTGSSAVWDISTWDVAVWGGGNVSQDNPTGVAGMGRYVAYALRGSSSSPTTLIVVDALYTPAGYL
jgi:hypothetical protein